MSWSTAPPILHKLYAEQQTQTANVTNGFVLLLKIRHALTQVSAHHIRALN